MVTVIGVVFFFNDTATTEIYTLSLHDALPISTTDATPVQSVSDMPDFTVSTEGVHSRLRSLNPYRATGPDDSSPRGKIYS